MGCTILQPVSDPLVQLGPRCLGHASIRGEPDEVVPEAERLLSRRGAWGSKDQLLSFERFKVPDGKGTSLVGQQGHERGPRKLDPQDRCGADEVALRRPESVEASGEQCLHRGRDRKWSFLT